jgi:excisionase family DNA binding protein
MKSTFELLTSDETAKRLRISKACLWQKCRTGEMPHIKLSARNFRFRESDLERWLKERSR